MDNSLNSILSDRASWSKYDPAIQNYLAEMARKKDEEAAQLSQSNIYGNGTTAIAQSPDNKLSVLMQPESQPQQQMPQNYLRNNTTGATYGFNSVPRDQAGPALDYSSPIEIGGVGKGYRVKGDPFSVVLSDGRKVSLGNDSAATYQKQMQDLQMQKAKQALEEGATDIQMKKQQLAAGGRQQVPAGYRYTPEGNMEPIPGGPADQKMAGQYNADTAQLQSSQADLDRLATSANELLKTANLGRITGLTGVLPNIPGMEGADAQAKLNTLKSQVGFGVLQAMRNASKTGGALGNVSDAEGKRLEANLAALENAQSEKQMRESLQKIVDFSEQAKDRLAAAYNMKHNPKSSSTAVVPNAIKTGATPAVNAMGWQLHVDANGNKAYVGPNGQIQEVK